MNQPERSIFMADVSVSTADLEQAWKSRCQSGNFSRGVLGLGQIRVMGKSGDATLQFPRIASLDALSELAPDEQYAVQAAQAIIEQAQHESRTVFAVEPGHEPERLTEYRPDAESLMIVARIAGG
jgi:hypothetical protein